MPASMVSKMNDQKQGDLTTKLHGTNRGFRKLHATVVKKSRSVNKSRVQKAESFRRLASLFLGWRTPHHSPALPRGRDRQQASPVPMLPRRSNVSRNATHVHSGRTRTKENRYHPRRALAAWISTFFDLCCAVFTADKCCAVVRDTKETKTDPRATI